MALPTFSRLPPILPGWLGGNCHWGPWANLFCEQRERSQRAEMWPQAEISCAPSHVLDAVSIVPEIPFPSQEHSGDDEHLLAHSQVFPFTLLPSAQVNMCWKWGFLWKPPCWAVMSLLRRSFIQVGAGAVRVGIPPWSIAPLTFKVCVYHCLLFAECSDRRCQRFDCAAK